MEKRLATVDCSNGMKQFGCLCRYHPLARFRRASTHSKVMVAPEHAYAAAAACTSVIHERIGRLPEHMKPKR